jgi:ATP-dependent Clp protease, protease subunit
VDRRQLATWLQEKLFERRIVLVTGVLDDLLAAQVAAQLTALDAANDAPIEIHLDSSDGSLEAAFAIMDAIDGVRAPVRAHCRGRVGGPALGVLAAAAHRVSAPHARFRLGQPTGRFTGTPESIAAQSRQQTDLLWRFHARLAQVTGRPAEEIAEDMRRGHHLDAQEALVYGLIESIATTS